MADTNRQVLFQLDSKDGSILDAIGIDGPEPHGFTIHNGVFYVYTVADSWKVKRIRNNPRVRVAACNVRGTVKGPWLEGTASIIEGDERRSADKLLDRKYFLKVIANFIPGRPARAMIKITPA